MPSSKDNYTPQLNFLSSFLHKELPAFTPIVLFNMQQTYMKQQNEETQQKKAALKEAQAWITRFETILENLLKCLKREKKEKDKGLPTGFIDDEKMRLTQDFLGYESIFYETVIDKGFKVAFDTEGESKLKTVCIATVQHIVRNALCIGNETKWTQSEKQHSEQLRYYPKIGYSLPLDECVVAENELWNYIQEPSTVTRDGKQVTVKRLLTFIRTGNHELLISQMADSTHYECWLQRVIIRIGNSISKYREDADKGTEIIDETKKDNTDDAGNTEALNEEVAKAREIANRPFYVKLDIASHWAYYMAQMQIMSKACTKQYEVWLLRLGFPQMFMGMADTASSETEKNDDSSEEREDGICIDDTRLILACLSHDKDWKAKQQETDMNGTLIWANRSVLAHSRSSFTDHQNKALVNISKLNSLFLKRLDGEMPGWTSKSKEYFVRLLHSDETLNENSTSELATSFKEFFKDDENKEFPLLDILAGNVPKDQEKELDAFLGDHEYKSVTDLLDEYFKRLSMQPAAGADCLVCQNVSDLAVSRKTGMITQEMITDSKKLGEKIKELSSGDSILQVEITVGDTNIYYTIEKNLRKILEDLSRNLNETDEKIEPVIFPTEQLANGEKKTNDKTMTVSMRRKLFLVDTIKKLLL